MVYVFSTREALVAYSFGLLGLILVKVLAPGFYARQNIRTPVKIALVSLFATQAMNLAFVWHLKHAGLALAIGLAACLNAALLYRGLRRHQIYTPQPGWPIFYGKLGVALLIMGVVLWFGSGSDAGWLTYGTGERVIRLVGLVVFGAAAYFATLWGLGFRLRDFKRRAA